MNMKPLIWLIVATLSISSATAQRVLTMDDAIEISITGSPSLQKSALNLEQYQRLLDAQKASLKSQFSLELNPLAYNQSREFDPRVSQWYTNQTLSSTGTLSIAQPIVWTGATVSLRNSFGWRNNISEVMGQDQSFNNSNRAFSNKLYLSIDQPLFTSNKLRIQLSRIQMDYENALISYSLTRLTLEQNITTQFYAVYMAQENVHIAKEELANAQQNNDVIKEKVNLDVSPRSELFQSEINLSTAQSGLENSLVSLESAKDAMKQTLGLPLSDDILISADVTMTPVDINPELAIDNALTTRLELRQREITNKMSEYALIEVKDAGKFQGSLSMSVGIGGDDTNFNRIYDSPTSTPSVSLTLRVPIFDWGARKNRIKAQKLRMNMEFIDEEQELITIELDVRKTCRNLSNLVSQIEIAKKSVVNAQQTYDLNVMKYREGDITGMEMNQFQSQLSSQKLGLAQKMISYRTELLNLKVVSLYDFEKNSPINPLLIYSAETHQKVYKHKQKRK